MAFSTKLFVVVVALFSQGLCATHIRRSTDSATPVEELLANARARLDEMGAELSKMTGTTPEELRATLEAKTRELQTRAQNVMEEVKKQVEAHGSELPEKTREVFNEVVAHLNSTVDNLKSQAPATMDEMSAVQARFTENFKSSMETFLEETKKLAKAAGDETGEVHDQVATFARNAFTQGMELLTTLNNQVKAAVEQAGKS